MYERLLMDFVCVCNHCGKTIEREFLYCPWCGKENAEVADNGLIIMSSYYNDPTPTMIKKWSSLQAMQEETFTKIISGSAPVDSFDEFVASWNRLGGEDITKEVNEWYAERYLNQ